MVWKEASLEESNEWPHPNEGVLGTSHYNSSLTDYVPRIYVFPSM